MVSLGVKPKPKKTTLFISIPVILVVVVVLLLQFTQSGYLTTVPYRPAFTEISDHVYINQGYAGDRQELLEMIKQAEDRVYEFFGGLNYQEDTIFIISDDEKLTRKLGEDHGTVIVYYPSEKHYICISEEYLEIDILAHEITHAELHARLSTRAQKAIPTWFDEGIALQNDYRERYSEAQWAEQTDNGENAVALEDMDTPAEFYAGEAEDRRFRYLNAKHELNVWMAAYGQQGLLELLEKLNDGADFNTVYGSIDSILLAKPAGFNSEPDQNITPVDSETSSVAGPYGEISLSVPDTWSYEPVHVDEEGLMYGLYGLILKPLAASEGQIELVCSDSFGVCGTGLTTEDITLATVTAHVGTYDDHKHWDFVTIGAENPQIVIQHTDCDSWTDEMWDEAMTILDTMVWNMDKTEGGIGRYSQESEDDTIAVSMSVSNVTPSGLTVHFRQYDKRDTEELTYGEGYQLEKFNGNDWDEVPQIIDNGAFNDIGYILPSEGEAEIEINWEWLYGRLSPGRYRITKTIVDVRKVGNNPLYSLTSEFFIMDSDIVRTYEMTDAALSEEFIEQEKLVTMVRYYEMTDGTWRTDTNTYKYRLEITGRMGGAAKDSTFVYLSNTEDISFERAYMAAGLSSNMNDYFDPSEAVLVAMK